MGKTTRFFSLITFVLAFALIVTTLVSLVTTEWYTGEEGVHYGLVSHCEGDKTISAKGYNVTFCTSFSFSDFANKTEEGMAGALLCVVLLSVFSMGVLCLTCCANTNLLVTFFLVLSWIGSAGVCITYYVYQKDRITTDMKLGYSYYAAMISVLLAMFSSLFSMLGRDKKKSSGEYQQIQ